MRLTRNLGGFKKSAYNGTVSAVHNEENDGIVFSVKVYLAGACERKPKVDEHGEPVVTVIPERTVVEYEFSCPESFLNMGD